MNCTADFHEISYWWFLLIYVDVQFWLKSDKNNRQYITTTCISHFEYNSLNIYLSEKIYGTTVAEKNEIRIVFQLFLRCVRVLRFLSCYAVRTFCKLFICLIAVCDRYCSPSGITLRTIIFVHKKASLFRTATKSQSRAAITSSSLNLILHYLLVSDSVLSLFFLISWGGVRRSPLGTSATNWPIVPAPDDRWVWSIWWN
jgi:hypothetical protein